MKCLVCFFVLWAAIPVGAQDIDWYSADPVSAFRALAAQSGPTDKKPQKIAASVVDDSLKEAQQALDALKKVVEMPKDATLGKPIRQFYVRADKLSKYVPGIDLKELLIDGKSRFYPVMANGKAVSSVQIRMNTKRSWGELHDVTLAKAIHATREARSKLSKVPLDSFIVVDVPALNAVFIAEPADPARGVKEMMLTPLFDSQDLSLKAGEAKQASVVFTALASHARKAINQDAPGR